MDSGGDCTPWERDMAGVRGEGGMRGASDILGRPSGGGGVGGGGGGCSSIYIAFA